ncbi:MAG: FAD-dependent oxidoreductase [Bacteroidia bacterium]|nr:FAD-dependent oxidoreductase [Bacteroidia bacterium]
MKLIIAGAGSSGLGVALAAARRGWQVLLLDARDIGGGTSTASTKLIHGGLRYLESAVRSFRYADWRLVREALEERAWMIRSHSQLCKPLPLVVPIRSRVEQLYYGVGLYLYHYLSIPHRLAAPSWVDLESFQRLFPLARSVFKGGWRYWDGQFQDRLYLVHLALFLKQRYIFEVRPYHRVTEISSGGRRVRVRVQVADGSFYEEEGDFFVNATGPWADELRRKVRPDAVPRLRVSRGSHLVLPAEFLPIQEGFLIPKTEDGRLLFILPWLESTVLVGTTDVEVAQPEWTPSVPAAEEEYLLTYLRRYFKVEDPFPVKARFAGFRPLVAESSRSTARLARSHIVEVWPQQRFLSLMGGKWTTFRKMGEDAVAAIAQAVSISLPAGDKVESIEPDLSELEELRKIYSLPLLSDEAFCEGEVRFWKRVGWALYPGDIVEGRWQLHLIDQVRAERLKAVLGERWSELT